MKKKMKLLPYKTILSSSILSISLFSNSVTAVTVSIGDLTYDSVVHPDIIIDTKNNRDWLRWDKFVDLTYSEVSNLTTTGAYENWNIANFVDAQLFLDALVPSYKVNSCHDTSNEGCWSDTVAPYDYHQLLGDSHIFGSSYDTIFFESHLADKSGFIIVTNSGSVVNVNKYSSFDSISTADTFGTIGWLLYRKHPEVQVSIVVNEPKYAGLFGLGLVSIFLYRRKKV